MKIFQKTTSKNWIITIDFEWTSFCDGEWPFFVSGSFCDWKFLEEYKIPVPPHRGANILLPINIELPIKLNKIELKIYEGSHKYWIEPQASCPNSEIYRGWQSYSVNCFGTRNVLVEKS